MAKPASETKIMVIDDSKTIRRSAEVILKKEGFQIELAEDGFESLSKIINFDPDLIFIDIMMPRLDGYQTCTLIRNNPKFAKTPIVMLSSKDGLFDRAKGKVVGADEHVTKPFIKEDLLETVYKLLPDIGWN